MRLHRFCQLIGCLLAAALISIFANSHIRFYQEHGRHAFFEEDEEELTIFPDEPRGRHAAANRHEASVTDPMDIPETQFYWWAIGAAVVVGMLVWAVPFSSDPSGDID